MAEACRYWTRTSIIESRATHADAGLACRLNIGELMLPDGEVILFRLALTGNFCQWAWHAFLPKRASGHTDLHAHLHVPKLVMVRLIGQSGPEMRCGTTARDRLKCRSPIQLPWLSGKAALRTHPTIFSRTVCRHFRALCRISLGKFSLLGIGQLRCLCVSNPKCRQRINSKSHTRVAEPRSRRVFACYRTGCRHMYHNDDSGSDDFGGTRLRPPSRTMRIAAMSRAVHALSGEEPKLLRDWVAQQMLGSRDNKLLAEFDAQPLSRHPGFHTVFALRNRLVEDELALAATHGSVQYVILRAGLDSFAYRSPAMMDRLQVFKVDHPGSSAWKRQCVTEIGLSVPEHLQFVPVDFETGVLSERLYAAGLDRRKPVFASLLGVSQYLTAATLSQLLRDVAWLTEAGCTLVMEHVPPLSLLGEKERTTLERSIAGYAQDGEPWLTFLSSDDLIALLLERGFTHASPVSNAELNQHYFQTPAKHASLAAAAAAAYVRAVVDPARLSLAVAFGVGTA